MRIALISSLAAVAVLATSAPAADWQRDGLAWRVVLADADVQDLKHDAATVIRFVPDPTARTAVTAVVEVLDLVNDLGDRSGVEVSGVLGVPGVFIWPARGATPFVQLVSLQADAKRDLDAAARRWADLARGVGAGWAGAGRCVLRAHPDGTVSLVGGVAGRFRLDRRPDGSVLLKPVEAVAGPVIRGPVVWATRWAYATAGAVRWTLRAVPGP